MIRTVAVQIVLDADRLSLGSLVFPFDALLAVDSWGKCCLVVDGENEAVGDSWRGLLLAMGRQQVDFAAGEDLNALERFVDPSAVTPAGPPLAALADTDHNP
jgi:hypothetical protein